MKILISAIIALSCLGAHAIPARQVKWSKAKLGDVRIMDVGNQYFGPAVVGRLSPTSFTVELTGLTVTDPNLTTRKVKSVLQFVPADVADPMDPAWQSLKEFMAIKLGKDDCGGSCNPPRTVSKLVGIIYDYNDLTTDDNACMGADLEVLDSGSTTVKHCYVITPLEIIEYAP